jgi:transcriptional regulator with XRE-family HTH domain
MAPMAERAGLSFGGLLRRLRDEAGLTQDELAEAAQVSQRAISDLERGINRTARKDTAQLLADALGLDAKARDLFVAAARGRGQAAARVAAREVLDVRSLTGCDDERGQIIELLPSAQHGQCSAVLIEGEPVVGVQVGAWPPERAIPSARKKVPGLREGFRYHDLRHYLASLLIAHGADVKLVQARLRHASGKSTLDTYRACKYLLRTGG